MYSLKELLQKVIDECGSDLHLTVGIPPVIRKNGMLIRLGDEEIDAEDTENFSREILKEKFNEILNIGEIDFPYSIEGIGRFRINIFKQQGVYAIAIRIIAADIPTLEKLNHPQIVRELTKKRSGLILITGPTGSGKSTTLASMINEINDSRGAHIITLEDPIEYIHKHKKSIINQREIGIDSKSYHSALRSILREDPDVILVGEMRDLETIAAALTAAETGHLVLSTLHTIGAAKTIDRIIDVFPADQQQQIKGQLSTVLEGIISQQLLPNINNDSREAALEIMVITSGIRNLIREGKTHQIDSIIQTGSKFGMKSMDSSISELLRKGMISEKIAFEYCVNEQNIKSMVNINYF